MSLLTIFTPILNAILFSLSGRNTHLRPAAFAAIFSILALLVVTLPEMVQGDVASTLIGSWVYSGLFEVDWVFGVDPLTFVMLFVVLTVSSFVHLYSTAYMSEDPHIPRFMSYLSLFTFFMLILVSSENLVSLFLGWEGVGLCSYLLISFWFTRTAANKAAIKAMIVNRVADLALTIGIVAAFFIFQTVEFGPLFGLAPFATNLSLVTFLLFVGAMGKSAQIGLHTWLPDAMEGPTPVSALIHAATMVTAGVFLIIRCSALFEQAPDILLFVTFIGAATAFMAATSGLLQNDLKKIIAYSTCSQLGYMVFICGLSGYAISFFHLTNHAFFKALLFLSAGAVIHAVSNEQDLRRLGGLIRLLPFTYTMFVIGSLALMGFPFLTGFYSKDLILEVVAGQLTIPASFAYWLGLVTALFTAFYSFRLLYLAFYSRSRSPYAYLMHVHELSPNLAIPLALLALGSIFFGFFARDLFIGFGTVFWNGAIPVSTPAQLAGEFLSAGAKLVPLAGSTAAVLAVFFLTVTYRNPFNRVLYRFLSHKWYFDTVYNQLINQPLLKASYHTVFKPVDKGILELTGPTGLGAATVRVAYRTTTAQTGRIYDYAWFMFFILLYFFAGTDLACLGIFVGINRWGGEYYKNPTFAFVRFFMLSTSIGLVTSLPLVLTDLYWLDPGVLLRLAPTWQSAISDITENMSVGTTVKAISGMVFSLSLVWPTITPLYLFLVLIASSIVVVYGVMHSYIILRRCADLRWAIEQRSAKEAYDATKFQIRKQMQQNIERGRLDSSVREEYYCDLYISDPLAAPHATHLGAELSTKDCFDVVFGFFFLLAPFVLFAWWLGRTVTDEFLGERVVRLLAPLGLLGLIAFLCYSLVLDSTAITFLDHCASCRVQWDLQMKDLPAKLQKFADRLPPYDPTWVKPEPWKWPWWLDYSQWRWPGLMNLAKRLASEPHDPYNYRPPWS